jgi:hypothetical protein
MEQQVQEAIDILTGALKDAKKFDQGNDTAGTRVRKAMQLVKAKAQATRENISQQRGASKIIK